MVSFARKDGIVLALAVVILLIGTATGNAIAMFVASMIALFAVAVFYRRHIGSSSIVAAMAAAVVAIAVVVLISTS